MKVSAVVPAFNEEKLIVQSLGAIRNAMAAFTERGWESELIVCDNNSTDRTAELARQAGATGDTENARAKRGVVRVYGSREMHAAGHGRALVA